MQLAAKLQQLLGLPHAVQARRARRRRLAGLESLEHRRLMAAEIFVDDQGDDWATGAADQPFQTIRRALDAAQPGDVITLRNGVYAGGFTIDVDNLTLRSAPGEWAVIESPLTELTDGRANSVIRYNFDVQGGRLENLEIVGGYWYGVMFWDWWDSNWEAGSTHVGASGITLDGLKIHDTGVDAVKITPGADDITIVNCEIYNAGRRTTVSADGIDNNNGDRMVARGNYIHDIPGIGVVVTGGSIDSIVEQNLIVDTAGAGVVAGFYTEAEWMEPDVNPDYFAAIRPVVRNNLIVDAGQAGIGVYAADHARIYHNTLVNPAADAQAAIQFGGVRLWLSDADPFHHVASVDPVVVNNLITASADNDTRMIDVREGAYVGALTLDHNLYHSEHVSGLRFIDRNLTGEGTPEQTFTPWRTLYGYDPNSLSADPRLGVDWRLLSDSPAIGVAMPMPELVVDFDGQVRGDGSAGSDGPDVGADEFAIGALRAVPPAPFGTPSLELDQGRYHDLESNSILIKVRRHGSADDTVAVRYTTLDGGAQAGLDYTPVAGRLEFLPGETEKTVVVPLLGDALPEGDEHFQFRLFDPTTDGALPVRLGHQATASLTIDDAQTPITLNYRTLWVSNAGSDVHGDGSETNPWKSLQHAADNVGPGDYVIVEPGRYWGMNLTTDGKPDARITFHARPGVLIDEPNPENGQDGVNLEGADYVTIEGFEIQNMPRAGLRSVNNRGAVLRGNLVDNNGWWGVLTGWSEELLVENNVASRSQREHGIYISNSSDDAIVRNNVVWGNHASGIQFNADGYLEGDGVHSRNVVEGNVVYGNGVGGGAAINLDGFQDGVVQNNLLYDNHATGIVLYVGFAAEPSTNNLIRNNTVVMADDARWALLVWNGSSGNSFVNNILLNRNPDRGSVTIETGSEPARSDLNLLSGRFQIDGYSQDFAAWQAFTGGQDANSTAVPSAELAALLDQLFVDPSAHHYALNPDGPGVDVGDPTAAPAVDLYHRDRPAGDGVDLGALEAGLFGSTVQFASPHFVGYESIGMAEIVVERTGDSSVAAVVAWRLAPGSADAGDDFVQSAGKLLFRPGETRKTFQVFLRDDLQIESLETLQLELQTMDAPFVGDPFVSDPFSGDSSVGDPFVGDPTGLATLHLVSDDAWRPGVVGFATSSVTFDETAGVATIVVKRSGGADGPVAVDYAVERFTPPKPATWIKKHTDLLYPDDHDKPADAGDDFLSVAGRIEFADGQTEQTIVVPLVDDAWYETDEAFMVRLSEPTGGATLSDKSAIKVRLRSEETKQPGLFSFGAAAYSTVENAPAVELVVVRQGGGNVAASVKLHHTGAGDGLALGSAWQPSDYGALPDELHFAPGEMTKTIVVPLVNDSIAESLEAFSVQLYSPTNDAQIGSIAKTVVTIADDESTFYFRGATPGAWSYSIGESAGLLPVIVERVGSLAAPASVVVSTSDWGSATPGVDFTPVHTTVEFAPGESSKVVQIPILNDLLQEPSESFGVSMSGAVGALQGSWTWTASIQDDDVAASPGRFELAASSFAVAENGGSLLVTVVRTGGSDGAASVQYRTSDGAAGMPSSRTAWAGSDYSSRSGVLQFAPGETSKTFSVPITNDSRVESDEFFSVRLSGPTGGATLGPVASAVVTIVEDDSALEFGTSNYSVSEGAGFVSITLVRKGSTAGAASVDLKVGGSSASAGADFTPLASPTIQFAPGESIKTVQLQIVDDAFAEGDEWFSLSLANAVSAALGGSLWGGVKIVDNDA